MRPHGAERIRAEVVSIDRYLRLIASPSQLWCTPARSINPNESDEFQPRVVRHRVESTVRFAVELGYEVIVVRDATADYSNEEMHAALDINIPNYASAIVTTNEIVASMASLQEGR